MRILRLIAKLILVEIPLKRRQRLYSIDPSCSLGLRFGVTHSVPASDRVYVRTGKGCVLNCRIVFESTAGFVRIGDQTDIGNSLIICRNNVTIGNHVTMAWGITVYDHDSHSLDLNDRRKDHARIYRDTRAGCALENKDWSTVASAPIEIKDDAWIGMNATILKGVTIGRGAVVGAGSVVTKDVPDFCVVAGNPARPIRQTKGAAS